MLLLQPQLLQPIRWGDRFPFYGQFIHDNKIWPLYVSWLIQVTVIRTRIFVVATGTAFLRLNILVLYESFPLLHGITIFLTQSTPKIACQISSTWTSQPMVERRGRPRPFVHGSIYDMACRYFQNMLRIQRLKIIFRRSNALWNSTA